ncbi:hypothetical protein A3K79_05295 [Candidatus Bathyarchaeota archaeon RBG_13_46_16b]|nr:MAG: hypothetical protein A3K79_05295 [Candidatus Bathyarchaeota archaeon RBG_13_46_16b]
MESLRAFARLVRPRHTGQIVGIVGILSIVERGFSIHSAFAVISSLFASFAIFVLDDAHDYQGDLTAHPERPIPKGVITVRQAYLAGVVLLSVGILAASTLLLYQFTIFLTLMIVAIAIVFFNIPSLLRAFIIAFLIWGLFPFSSFPTVKIMIFGLIVALPHIGGSIAKDFLHSSGDTAQGLNPPPHRSKYIASSAFFLSGAIIWMPIISSFFTWFYLPPIVLTCVTCIVLGVSVLKEEYRRVYAYGRIGMVSSLIVFLVGEI